jgi:hypothetical protein
MSTPIDGRVDGGFEPLVADIASEGLPRADPATPVRLEPAPFARLLDRVVHEHITGHLDRAIAAGWFLVSEAQREAAQRAHEEMLGVDLLLERLLVESSRALADEDIAHRALKGPVVARTTYADPSLRSFGDVDLLVEGNRFDDAIERLTTGGGHARYREPRRRFTARFGKGVCVVTSEGFEIDVHRVFVAGPFGLAIDADDLFADPDSITIGTTVVPVPPRTVQFLHACYHTALTTPRITAVRDVAEFLCGGAVDAERVLAVARSWRSRAVVQRAVAVTRERLSASIDGPLVEWSATYAPDRFERAALRPYITTSRSYGAQMAAGMWALRGIRPRLEYGAALLLPERSYVQDREGSYVRRWKRALSLARRSRDPR